MPRPSPQTDRVLAAVNALATEPDGLTLTELARRLDANTASCVHMLAAMADAGYVVRDATSRRYFVGPALILPGQVAAARYPALGAARREMDELVRTLGVTCLAFARDGDEARLVHRSFDPRLAPPGVQLGDTLPIVPPLGSVYVAWADDATVEAWLARGELRASAARAARDALGAIRTLGYVVELVPGEPLLHELGRLLARARRTGTARTRPRWATDDPSFVATRLDAATEYSVSSIGVPVFDEDGGVRLAVSLTGLPARLDGRQVARLGRAARAAADRATASSGGRVPPRRRATRRPATISAP